MDNIYKDIELAISKCKLEYSYKILDFSDIYSFTTENIAEYLPYFDLENKSLFTVGSSTDQVINASLMGSKNITVFDICPFTKYYFYLKKAAIMTLSYEDFCSFFPYEHPHLELCTRDTFCEYYFNIISPVLKEESFDSYVFWKTLFKHFNTSSITRRLFDVVDMNTLDVIKKCNLYLRDEKMYINTQNAIKDVYPTFSVGKRGDLFSLKNNDLNGNFDNIWLSNLATYYGMHQYKKLVDKLYDKLNLNGEMLFTYLYRYVITANHISSCDIYNIKMLKRFFYDYDFDFIDFDSILNEGEITKYRDSILKCKKLQLRPKKRTHLELFK